MKKLLVTVCALGALAALGLPSANAANPATVDVSVTITAQALSVRVDTPSWPIGEVAESATATSPTITATNDTNVASATENLTIQCSGSANWSAGTDAGDETFRMAATGGALSDEPLSGTAVALTTTPLARLGTVTFTLGFTAPSSTAYGGTPQTITVTVNAVSPP